MIRFDRERMAEVRAAHDLWWRGELDRPLIGVVISGAHDVERKAPAPELAQDNCADFSWSPEQVIDALDESMSANEYLGDAFPFVNFASFGPGVLAAFCGAQLDNSTGRVWFFPREKKDISDIHVKYDPQNEYVQRIKAIYRAGLERWQGSVLMGMPDLGGVLDVAATFRGSEELLMDMYDAPEEVLRLDGEIRRAWYEAYDDLAQVLAPQQGYTDWSGLMSSKPSYILQCDFCYMIGNPMFRRFVLEGLREDTHRLTNTIYHLDGVGELNHLDDVLALDELNAVQWMPGDGQPPIRQWKDVYRRIQAAGKGMWLAGGAQDYLDIVSELHGTPYACIGLGRDDMELAGRILAAR